MNTMSEKEKHNDAKSILARTATYTSKRARRAQTKLKQRVGKGDETKDEVFDEFVINFNNQQSVAARLHTELKNYLRCITAMQVATTNFGDAVKDVYENDWTGRETIIKSFSEANSNWNKLSVSLTDEILEPLVSYQKPFPDVKIRINKRARKLVDYDHSRHIVDTLRAKGATKSGDIKKLNQAEEEYQRAKDVFIELTSELYEELPALYDSRIGFYVSCFQSIFTLEEVFHREASYIAHQLNDLMDQLITDFSAGTYSTRKPFSAGLETTSNSSEKEDSSVNSLAQFYDVAMPLDDNTSIDSQDDEHNDLSSGHNDLSSEQSLNYMGSSDKDDMKDNDGSEVNSASSNEQIIPVEVIRPEAPPPPLPNRPIMQDQPPTSVPVENNNEQSDTIIPSEPTVCKPSDPPPPQPQPQPIPQLPPPPTDISPTHECHSPEMSKTTSVEIKSGESDELPSNNIVAYKNVQSPDNANKNNLIVPSAIYKVVTTHKYTPEDEDELSFERGEIVHVIPYEDPEEQDEGWLMGVMDSTGLVGVFPENFSKVIT